MSWEIAAGEAGRLAALPAGDRYLVTLQLIADWGEGWGLRDAEGWIVERRDDGGGDAFPLWPHSELAAPCAVGRWEGAEPEKLGVDELLEDLLPLLAEDGLRVHVFPTPQSEGTLLPAAEVSARLEAELALGDFGD